MTKYLIAFWMFFLLQLAHAQNTNAIQDTVRFNQVVEMIESKSAFNLYYASEWTDHLLFTNVPSLSEPELLIKWLAEKADLSVTILESNQVIFTKGFTIQTNYADRYANYLADRALFKRDTIVYAPPQLQEEESSDINPEYDLFEIGTQAEGKGQKMARLSGKVADISNGEPLVGAVIYIDRISNGTVTNLYGYYSIALPKGHYRVEYRSVGMKTTYRNVEVHSDGSLDVELHSKPQALKEVLVTAKSDDNVRNLKMGIEKLSVKTMKQLPTGIGEADVIKSALLLPGVQSVGEAASGFNVRGGSTDQNLILLNEAPIVNTSHFFGFFSGFNSDLTKDITLYKSGIPAKYGGRISSVMDISLKEGNRKELDISGGISPVSARLIVDAPIVKDKASFAIGARSTYSNWLLKLLDDPKLKNSSAGFQDLQGNFSIDLDEKNSLYLSGYYSHDEFDYFLEDAFQYQTIASTLKWKHVFNPKLFSTYSAWMSHYNNRVESRTDSAMMNAVDYKMNQQGLKADFSYHTTQNHKWEFGASAIWYDLAPGVRTPLGDQSLAIPKTIDHEQALEGAVYVSDEFEINPSVSLAAGLRYSFYSNFGPKSQFVYAPGVPKNSETIIDTLHFGKGSITSYSGPEFRLSTNIKLSGTSSLKIGYNRGYQYVQMISNTVSMSPTDIWKLSDAHLKPQRGDQYSIGFYKKLRRNTIEASIETYYKDLRNILDYKGGAELVMNEHLETDVLNGTGKAYGVELMLQRKTGKLTGWVNYTYSRVLHRIDGEFEDEKVNGGNWFPSNYDKPHEFKLVSNFKASRRFNASANFFYSTGRPYTAPAGYFDFGGARRVLYTDRNEVRMPDYIRLDLAATINGNLRNKKANHGSLTFALYNVLGRRNAYNVFFRTEEGMVKGYKLSIFGEPIFTVTYNFKIMGNAKDDF